MLAVFQLYGPDHLFTLFFVAGSCLLLIRLFRKGESRPGFKVGIAFLAFLCFSSYPINQAAVASIGVNHGLSELLPLHLCDLTSFICGFALVTRRPLLCELAYFWGLAGTLQGLLTPDISHEFPNPAYLSFFLQHGVIVITAIVLPLGLGWTPRPGAARRTYLCLLGYAIVIYPLNLLFHTNFGFVIEKPDGASLLDVLGAWPWYIIWTLVIAAGIFCLLELPFIKKRAQSRQN